MIGVTSYNDVSAAEKINLLGAFGSLSLFQQLTVMGDAEWIKGNSSSMSIEADMFDRNTANSSLKQFALMIEADYPLMQGFDLKFMYDFFDPNTDIKGGAATRYSAGFEFMPFGRRRSTSPASFHEGQHVPKPGNHRPPGRFSSLSLEGY